MTDQIYGSTTSAGSPGSTSDVAKEQARSVAEDAKHGGQQVAAAAKDQTREVAGEAKAQAEHLYRQVQREAADQASAQQKRAASGLHALGDELGSMAEQSGGSGIAGDLARQASGHVRSAATWLESREPGDVMSEVADFARRRPGTFLAAAAAVGFFGGRLTRGLAAGSPDDTGAPARPDPSGGALPPPSQDGFAGHDVGVELRGTTGMPGRP
jgi:hypothetical protein